MDNEFVKPARNYPPPFPVRLQWPEYRALGKLSESLGKSRAESIRVMIRLMSGVLALAETETPALQEPDET